MKTYAIPLEKKEKKVLPQTKLGKKSLQESGFKKAYLLAALMLVIGLGLLTTGGIFFYLSFPIFLLIPIVIYFIPFLEMDFVLDNDDKLLQQIIDDLER